MTLDLHVHSVFSDGKDTPEDIVRAAIERGVDVLGFSDHAYTSFDTSYCMKKEDVPRYKATIAELKKRYEGRIRILCGIEQDVFSDDPPEGFDYVIGSVHYVRAGGEYYAVDESPAQTRRAVKAAFGGDLTAFARAYYEETARAAQDADIIGHFDLVEKFSETEPDLAPEGEDYTALWQNAVTRLLPYGKPFEINTGAVSRGYRADPYLSGEKLSFALARGAKVLLSSDAHNKETILFGFDTFGSLVPASQKTLDFLPFLNL
ncbi:MAG: histidinol-phosphatase [Clostridia bacterium]|nr:histidinol-phosphatase [Clostridia bacterium]